MTEQEARSSGKKWRVVGHTNTAPGSVAKVPVKVPKKVSISVSGKFEELQDLMGQKPEAGEPPRDAYAKSTLDFPQPKNLEVVKRTTGSITYRLNVKIQPQKLFTAYYGSATPDTPHRADGTLGGHEEKHKKQTRSFWTTASVRKLAIREKFKFDFTFPREEKEEVRQERMQTQLRAIKQYLTRCADHEGEKLLDGGKQPDGTPSVPPTFEGETE